METNELTQARNKYLGRLNEDILRDCLGHCQFSTLEVCKQNIFSVNSSSSDFFNLQTGGETPLYIADKVK